MFIYNFTGYKMTQTEQKTFFKDSNVHIEVQSLKQNMLVVSAKTQLFVRIFLWENFIMFCHNKFGANLLLNVTAIL